MDQQLEKLMKKLGEAINDTLSDSEQIADVIAKIKSGGFDVFLVLEATIGFNRLDDEEDPGGPQLVGKRRFDPELQITQQDMKFLKSLRIAVESDASGNGSERDKAA